MCLLQRKVWSKLLYNNHAVYLHTLTTHSSLFHFTYSIHFNYVSQLCPFTIFLSESHDGFVIIELEDLKIFQFVIGAGHTHTLWLSGKSY